MVVRSVFHESKKYYPNVFLEENYTLEYDRISILSYSNI